MSTPNTEATSLPLRLASASNLGYLTGLFSEEHRQRPAVLPGRRGTVPRGTVPGLRRGTRLRRMALLQTCVLVRGRSLLVQPGQRLVRVPQRQLRGGDRLRGATRLGLDLEWPEGVGAVAAGRLCLGLGVFAVLGGGVSGLLCGGGVLGLLTGRVFDLLGRGALLEVGRDALVLGEDVARIVC